MNNTDQVSCFIRTRLDLYYCVVLNINYKDLDSALLDGWKMDGEAFLILNQCLQPLQPPGLWVSGYWQKKRSTTVMKF